jgi:hypothetical protein
MTNTRGVDASGVCRSQQRMLKINVHYVLEFTASFFLSKFLWHLFSHEPNYETLDGLLRWFEGRVKTCDCYWHSAMPFGATC